MLNVGSLYLCDSWQPGPVHTMLKNGGQNFVSSDFNIAQIALLLRFRVHFKKKLRQQVMVSVGNITRATFP